MKLFLASKGNHPDSLQKLEDFVEDFEDKHLVYVPTAGNAKVYGGWKSKFSEEVPEILKRVRSYEIMELESCIYQDVIQKMKSADIVWFGGGLVGYLLYWMRRIRFDDYLQEILDNSTVYVGSSAGSMVMGNNMHLAAHYIDDPEPGADLLPGFGVLEFDIYPHYTDELSGEINQLWNKGKLCLLKDGEAITVVDGQVEILGEERWIEK